MNTKNSPLKIIIKLPIAFLQKHLKLLVLILFYYRLDCLQKTLITMWTEWWRLWGRSNSFNFTRRGTGTIQTPPAVLEPEMQYWQLTILYQRIKHRIYLMKKV